MNWKSLILGGLAGLVTGLIVGTASVTVAWVVIGWQAVQGLGLGYSTSQALASLSTGLLCGATPGATLGLLGGLLGGLIARKAGTKRAAFLWGALLGLGFGFAGGVCGYFASGFLAQ